jgi:hypothetical protein
MGYAHILWIYEDGIKDDNDREDLQKVLGEAVIKVCLCPDYAPTPKGRRRITRHPVRCHNNCVNHAAALHNSDE